MKNIPRTGRWKLPGRQISARFAQLKGLSVQRSNRSIGNSFLDLSGIGWATSCGGIVERIPALGMLDDFQCPLPLNESCLVSGLSVIGNRCFFLIGGWNGTYL